MNLYDDLNVASDASPAEIKAAYRKQAKRTHPDKGGSQKDFEKVTRANMVLSDPVKRSKYDRDGTVDDTIDNEVNGALGLVVSFFLGAINNAVQRGANPCEFDLLGGVKTALQTAVAGFEKAKGGIEKQQAQIRKVEQRLRLKKSGTDSLLKRALVSQANELAVQMAGIDKNISMHKAAIALAADHDFEREIVAPAADVMVRTDIPNAGLWRAFGGA